MKRISLIALLALMPALAGAHKEVSDIHSCLPENSHYYPETEFMPRGLTLEQFNSSLDLLEKTYAPLFQKRRMQLVVRRLWDDGTVNASAQRVTDSIRQINMYGGLARFPGMTADAFLLVACHEIGHHIGGAPTYPGEWASAESQSDYFAAKTCARKLWMQRGQMKGFSLTSADTAVVNDCRELHRNNRDVNVCVRSIEAARVLTEMIAELSREKQPRYTTPDKKVVTRTLLGYPSAQCRFDTYIAGAHCSVSPDVTPVQTSLEKAACSRSKGHEVGARPLCWFKPAPSGPILASY